MRLSRSLFLISGILGLFLVSFYFYEWKEYSFEKISLDFKEFILREDSQALKLRKIAIYNALEKYEESEALLLGILQKDALNKSVLGNLAILYSKQKKWQLAEPYFEGYFSLEGQAKDVLFYYTQFLDQQNKGFQYIEPLFIESLGRKGAKKEHLNFWYDYLIKKGFTWEAVSFIVSYLNGQWKSNSFWSYKINQTLNDIKAKNEKFSLYAKSLEATFLPIRFNSKRRYDFIKVRGDQSYFTLPESFVKEQRIEFSSSELKLDKEPNQEWDVVAVKSLSQLYIGSMVLEDVPVVICKKCKRRVGKSILEKMNYKRNEIQGWFKLSVPDREEKTSKSESL